MLKNLRAGEKGILIFIAILVIGMMGYQAMRGIVGEKDPGIPFYTTATPELKHQAESLYIRLGCSECHALWMVRSMMESVPATALDGIGSLRDEQWFYAYFFAELLQSVLLSWLLLVF